MPRHERRGTVKVGRRAAGGRKRSIAILVALLLLLAPDSLQAAPPRTYSYRVDDATYGPIGTLSYVIDLHDGKKVVTTEAHIRVTLLGVTLYRQEAFRRELWAGSRLVEFQGVTTENGKSVEINGRADGDHFVIVSPSGTTRSPGSIRPVSPLSVHTGGDQVFMPDTGLVTSVRVDDLGETTVTIDGTSSLARQYRIETADGKERYEVWMDPEHAPVRFTVRDAHSDDTFTLIR